MTMGATTVLPKIIDHRSSNTTLLDYWQYDWWPWTAWHHLNFLVAVAVAAVALLLLLLHLKINIIVEKSLVPNFIAVDLAAAYQSMKSEYASAVFAQQHSTTTTITSSASSTATSGHSRQILSTHPDGSEVSLLEHPHDPYCPYEFFELNIWETSMPKMDPFYEGLTI
ncbi:hypothetical protein ACHAXH_006994 [Discostella pseudostelligera]